MEYSEKQTAAMAFVNNIFSTGSFIALALLSVVGLTLGYAPDSNAQPALTSATYDAAAGNLVVTGTNMTNGDTIAVNKLTLTGEGGAEYALTSTNVTASSATTFSITLNAIDKAAVNQIINKNGSSANDSTPYNLAAADDWNANITAGDTSDAINAVTANNVLIGQTITFGANPGPLELFCCAMPLFSINATGGASGNPVTFSSLSPSVCIVHPTFGIFAIGAGVCTIAADQAGNANYSAAAQVTQVITINKQNVSLSFGSNPGPVTFASGGTFLIQIFPSSAPTGANPVTTTSLTAGVCSVAGTTVTIVAVGMCTIAANQAGNANYNPAQQVTQDIIVNAISQTITFGTNPGPRSFAGALALVVTATGGTSGNPIVFTSLTSSVCNNVSGLAFIGSVGTCVIAANQAGNATHLVAPQATQAITITQGTQTITFGVNPGPLTFAPNGTFSVNATATGYTGVSIGPVVFTSLTTSVCTVIGNTVTTVTKGICIIAADQPGNANIDPAPQITQSITINGIPQGIMFDTPPNANVGDSGTLFATGGLSGNPVVFTSITPSICIMTDSTYTAIAGGGCTIAADQAGNAFYAPALRITRGIGVNGVPPVVTLSAVATRKQHFGSNRDILIDHTLPIGGNISTEPRAIGAGHQLVFQFSGPINLPGFPGAVDSALFDIGSASAVVNPLANNEVIVSLTGIPDNKRVKVTLTNVNNIAVPFAASIGFMLGDVNGTRSINASDISAVKARSGQTTDASNYRFDINVSGTVNSSDISAVKARSGLTLPP